MPDPATTSTIPVTPAPAPVQPMQSPLLPPQMPPHQGMPAQAHSPQQKQQKIELADIHMPAKPSAWPPAPGWWIVTALLLGLLMLSIIKLIRYRRLKAQQKNIMQALGTLEDKLKQDKSTEALSEINILLRHLALMNYPRQQIASLTGKNWLKFLDNSGNTKEFTQGAGQLLANAPYSAQLPDSADIQNLTKVVSKWVKHISDKPAGTAGGKA